MTLRQNSPYSLLCRLPYFARLVCQHTGLIELSRLLFPVDKQIVAKEVKGLGIAITYSGSYDFYLRVCILVLNKKDPIGSTMVANVLKAFLDFAG